MTGVMGVARGVVGVARGAVGVVGECGDPVCSDDRMVILRGLEPK